MGDRENARISLAALDLTRLADADTQADIELLCRRAVQPWGTVAAVCVWPRFVEQCRRRLEGSGVRVATVANFPHGDGDLASVVAEVHDALARGAQEIDLVMPYARWLAGDRESTRELTARARAACGTTTLKIILETGRLVDPGHIADASRAAIDSGADFIKTSTGKTSVSATPQAVTAILETIRDAPRPVGIKIAGGIRTFAQAVHYLALTRRIMGQHWIAPERFRFGASALLDALGVVLAEDAHAGA